jgi:hypothetical protein
VQTPKNASGANQAPFPLQDFLDIV